MAQWVVDKDGYEVLSSEEFGDTKGFITPSEEQGMLQPTKEQLLQREVLKRRDEVLAGKRDYYSLSTEERNSIRDETVPFLLRVGEGVKLTPEGKAEFIKSVSSKEHPPIRGSDNKVYIYDEKSAQYMPFNPEGFDLGDIGEWIGAGGPAVTAGMLSGNKVLGQAAGGAIASITRQGISELLPGEESLTPRDRVMDVLTQAGLSGGAQGIVNAGAKVYEFSKPSNIIARKVIAASNTDASKAGIALQQRLKEKTGENVFFTVGEQTQDPWLIGLQQNAEQSFAGKRTALKLYNDRLNQAAKITGQLVDDLAKGGTKSDEVLGDWAEAKFKLAVEKAYEAAYKQADVDYAFLKDPAIAKTKVPLKTFWDKLEELKETYSNVRTTIKKGELQIGKTNIKEGMDMQNLAEMVDNRRILSKVARGKGRLFDGLDPQSEKHIASELVKALDKDLAQAVDYVGTDVKPLLDKANQNYRANMDIVRSMKGTVLGRLLKTDTLKPGETITQRLMKAKPSELEAVFKIGGFEDPYFVNSLRAQYAAELLQAGKEGARQLAPASAKWNPATVVQASKESAPGFNAVFKTKAERQAYEDVVDLNHRLSQFMPDPRPGLKPAQEAGEAGSVVGGFVAGGLSSTLIFGPKFFTKWFSGGSSARMIFDKEGQKLLRTIRTAKPGSKAFASAVIRLESIVLTEPSEEKVAQQFPEK